MDNPSSLEIYIPVEAEVKSIPLQSLPKSILRRMGLFPADARKLDDSPDGIWICPAVIRRKGQKAASRAASDEAANVSSVLGTDFWATQGPIQMSFVASSRAAYKVLKNALPGIPTSDTSHLPQGSASQTNEDALVIYRGRIYLSRKNKDQSQDRQKGHEQQRVSQSSSPLTSDVSHKRQKKEPQNNNNNNRPKKRQKRDASSKRRPDRNKRTGVREGSDVSSVKVASPVSQPADSVQGPNKARAEQASGETQSPSYKEAESTDQNGESDADAQADGGEFDRSLGRQTTRTEPGDAAASSTSLQMGCDFNELEQEERIAQMKARLRMRLNNRPE